jgi:hypothetical protein
VSDDGHKAAERAVDLFVYAPVGVALYLRDTVPTFVNLFVSRGRAELGQRRRQAKGQVSQAKSLGEYAVGVGGPKVREQVEKGIAMARKGAEAVIAGVAGEEAPETPVGVAPVPDEEPPPRPQRTDAPMPAAPAGETATATAAPPAPTAPTAATLGIPDYDELSASQVVERLDGLQRGELDAVRAYEEAHRARRTILYKIEQLTS